MGAAYESPFKDERARHTCHEDVQPLQKAEANKGTWLSVPSALQKLSIERRMSASRSPRDSGAVTCGDISWSLGRLKREGMISGGA